MISTEGTPNAAIPAKDMKRVSSLMSNANIPVIAMHQKPNSTLIDSASLRYMNPRLRYSFAEIDMLLLTLVFCS